MIIKDLRDISTLPSSTLIELECEYCHKTFWIKQKFVKSVLKRGVNALKYCSKECSADAHKIRKAYKCANCNKETTRTPGQLKDSNSGNVFCSKSCSATYNNSHHKEGRKFGPIKTKQCKHCTTIIGAKKSICNECKEKRIKKISIIKPNGKTIVKVIKRGDMLQCNICHREYKYERNKGTSELCSYCQFLIRRLKTKEESIKYKGGCCQMCGYNKSHRGLTFHHMDPKEKLFDLSDNIFKPWEEIQKELDKCILLCMNCHIELHSKGDNRNANM